MVSVLEATYETESAPVSVIICTYTEDRLDDTLSAIGSCSNQDVAPREIIVVVDHNPRLAAYLSRALKGVRVIENEESRGLSGARNTGVRAATSEIVAFLDDDARARPGWISSIAVAYEDSDVIAFGGAAHPNWPEKQPAWFPNEYGWVVGCSFVGQPTSRGPVRNLMGCNMSFRRSVFDLAGGFAAEIGRVGKRPAGCEETEFCIRLSQTHPSGTIIFDPTHGVDHRVTRDRTTWRYFLHRCWSEGNSKAIVSRLAGRVAGLSTERSYASKVLSKGFVANLLGAVRRLAPLEATRSGAILVGFGATVFGYLVGSIRGVDSGQVPRPVAQPAGAPGAPTTMAIPAKVVLADLADPSPDIAPVRPDGSTYQLARILGMAQGQPLGFVDIPLESGGVSGAEVQRRLVEAFGDVHPLFPTRAPNTTDLLATTVVIPTTWSRPLLLERCLDTLVVQDHPNYEVLVVDNRAPSDRTDYPDWPALSDPRVRIIAEPKPGASAARNAGFAQATGVVVAFTDDDVEVDPGWLGAVARCFGRFPDVDCVTGLVLPRELETPAQVLFERYGGFGKGFHGRTFPAAGATSPLFPYAAGMFGSGNNVAFRADALRAIGGYDENLGPGTAAHAGEDLALFVTLMTSGRALAYEPSAIIHHYHRSTFEELKSQVHDYGVGLTAMLTSLVMKDPRHLYGIARRVPQGIALLVRPASTRNAHRMAGYPKELVRAEIAGMVRGPFAYLWALWSSPRGTRRP
jgi:glycosyltransferase involved in cell wall biosynthesis